MYLKGVKELGKYMIIWNKKYYYMHYARLYNRTGIANYCSLQEDFMCDMLLYGGRG